MFQTALEPMNHPCRPLSDPGRGRYAKLGVRHRGSRWLAPSWRVSAAPCASRLPGWAGGIRSRDIEDALAANFRRALARISIAPSGLNSDIHADSEYRAHLVVVMAAGCRTGLGHEPS